MTARLPLLVFGTLAPTLNDAAVVCAHTAQTLCHTYDVTIVLDNMAPPATVFEGHQHIETIHLRDLIANQASYAAHKRLYILGDTSLSLFALEMYLLAPGPVILANGTAGRLIRDYHAVQPDWPKNYGMFLAENLGSEGETLAHGLLHHRRFSESLLREFPAFDQTQTLATANTFEALIRASDVTAPPSLVQTVNFRGKSPQKIATKDWREIRGKAREKLGVTGQNTLVLWTNEGAAAKAVETFAALQHDQENPVHFLCVSQTEDDLSSLVAAADALLISTQHTCSDMPPLAAYGALMHKPMITCGQMWAKALSEACCITLAHKDALHGMVSAIGAIALDSALVTYYSENLKNAGFPQLFDQKTQQLTNRLKQPQTPLACLKAKAHQGAHTPAHAPDTASKHPQILAPGPARSVALIGAVPPRSLVAKVFPEVNWEISPRFATPDLKAALAADMPTQAGDQAGKGQIDNQLALFGYDAPLLVANKSPFNPDEAGQNLDETGQNPVETGQTWPQIQEDLKATSEALCFGCLVEGAVCADALIAQQNHLNYSLDLCFSNIESPSPSPSTAAHFEDTCGLSWHLDPIRGFVKCLLIAGLRGRYQLNLKTCGVALLVADAVQSAALTNDHPVSLQADNQGVLSFSLLALDADSFAPLGADVLTKTLAECPLNLEWLPHG